MRRLPLLLAWLALSAAPAAAHPPLHGHWFFYKKIYRGRELPEPPEATLRLHYEFSSSGRSRLYWWHEGEGDHCLREGEYRVEGNELLEQVVWVDPDNTFGCASDPDMQLGRRTRTPFRLAGPDFALRFHLGDEPLEMVFKRLDEQGGK